MGGPFWARRDLGGWSIPKGEFDPAGEDPLIAALREFVEEIGVPAPTGTPIDLGVHVQRGGKRVHAFAVEADPTLAFLASNTFPLEWPRGSGRIQQFPEIDRAQWFELDEARRRVVSGQVPILDALAARLAARSGPTTSGPTTSRPTTSRPTTSGPATSGPAGRPSSSRTPPG